MVAAAAAVRSLSDDENEQGAGAAAFAVSHVGDGDSIRLANGTQLRLVQIDAPELGEGECYAQAARIVSTGC